MSWNYRVIRRIEDHHTSQEPVYSIATVFYDDASGDIKTFSADPVWPVGDTPEELRNDILRLLDAFGKPIVDQRPDGVLGEVDMPALPTN